MLMYSPTLGFFWHVRLELERSLLQILAFNSNENISIHLYPMSSSLHSSNKKIWCEVRCTVQIKIFWCSPDFVFEVPAAST